MTDEEWNRIRREQLEHEIREQAGAVTWGQLIGGGRSQEQIRTAVRRHELVRVLPRVYLNHTGRPTLEQREWLAVLWAGPAAALVPDPRIRRDAACSTTVHLAVGEGRRLTPPPGIVVHRVRHLDAMLHPWSTPPRLRYEHALLLHAAAAESETDLVDLLSRGIGRRGVKATDVSSALSLHTRLPRRALVTEIVADILGGTESVLERGYLQRVERAHRLPAPHRQSPRPGERRDLEYHDFGLVIELDGRMGHESWTDGNRDAGRDLADVADGKTPLRLRWHQVMIAPCTTAGLISAALRRRGWAGAVQPCGPTCPLNAGGSPGRAPRHPPTSAG